MYEYRITKYNPKYRNVKGVFEREEWISYSDIGQVFNGTKLTANEYVAKEEKYISGILLMMACENVKTMFLKNVEINSCDFEATFGVREGAALDVSEIPALCRLILREHIWAKLESERMFVHFGYDFYMYIGVANKCDDVLAKISDLGLYVEEYRSPYK